MPLDASDPMTRGGPTPHVKEWFVMINRLYRFGFLAMPIGTAAELPVPLESWNLVRMYGWQLFIHPESSLTSVEDSAGRCAIAIGDIFVAHGSTTLEDHLLSIARGGRASMDDLSGRFTIVVFERGRVAVLNDPLGSQTVFYSTDGRAVGSHAALVAEALGIERSRVVTRYMASEEYKSRTTRFLPGDLSLFDGIRLLVPNNELALPEARTRRFWPNRALRSTGVDEVYDLWDEYFTNYAAFLEPRYSLVLGLTGGMDSRAIIATLRAKGMHPRYETWDAMKEEERSRIPAMVAHLQGPHRWIDMKYRSEEPGFREIRQAAKSAAGFTRGTPLLPAQVAQGAGSRDLFLYGHGSAVASGAFSLMAKPWLPEEPLQRAYALYSGTTRKNASPEYRDFTLQAFQEFFENGNYYGELHSADVGDLLYWEHRMANWASLQIATFTVALNSHAAFNSRRLFESFWGLTDERRFTKGIHREIMMRYDPTLAAL